jgi:GDPmannose 4,6-dehydratase
MYSGDRLSNFFGYKSLTSPWRFVIKKNAVTGKQVIGLSVATGETHTVREFVEVAFKEVSVDIKWQGVGINEKGIDSKTGKVLVKVNEKYFRPAEVELLLGDPSKAEKELDWERKVSFQELVSGMVKYDLENDDFGGKE